MLLTYFLLICSTLGRGKDHLECPHYVVANVLNCNIIESEFKFNDCDIIVSKFMWCGIPLSRIECLVSLNWSQTSPAFWLGRLAFVSDGVSKSIADSRLKSPQLRLGHPRVDELQPLSLMYSTRPCCLV